MAAQPSQPALVRPPFGPALPALLRERLGVPVAVTVAAAVALLVTVLAVGLALRARDVRVGQAGPPAFELRYPRAVLRPVAPRPGELVRLEGPAGAPARQSLAARRLRLPGYRGAVGGLLPAYADAYVAGLRRRLPGLVVVDEGRARLGEVTGYQVGYRAQEGARTLYGRDFLLVPDRPGARDALVLSSLQVGAGRGPAAQAQVVRVGRAVKQALRSVRFTGEGG